MSSKVLILLPNANDHIEAEKVDQSKYETHFLHASDEVKNKKMPTFEYSEFLAKPGFLNSYVDRAVAYIDEHDISGVMYGHDLSSVVASVVCERTGHRGPSLDSTFVALHKYYTRKANPSNMWFEYVNLNDTDETWKLKMRYPCFLKAPFLTSSKGCYAVKNEEELRTALHSLREITFPYFKGYANFFAKYLDLKKFPLAMENLAVVEELIECKEEYCVEFWVDVNGIYSTYSTHAICFCNQKEDIVTGFIYPQFTLNQKENATLIKTGEDFGRRIGLRETFFNVEMWKIGNEFKFVELNCRCLSFSSALYTKMYDLSNYESAIALACGKKENIPMNPASIAYKDGDQITGQFYVLTNEEGQAKKLIDFDYARNGSITDGAYNNRGTGIELLVSEDSIVEQTSTRGFALCLFMITANSPVEMFDNMRRVRKKILLCKDHPDLCVFEMKIDNSVSF